MKRALVLLAILTTACQAAQFGQLKLEPAGGWRLPRYESLPRNTAYAGAAFAVHTFPSGETVVWHGTGKVGRAFVESRTTFEPAPIDTPRDEWPLFDEGRSWPREELLPEVPARYYSPGGVAYDDATGRLLFGADSWYFTEGNASRWVAAVDYESGEVVAKPSVPLVQHQFSMSFVVIPEAFADAYLGGRRLGLGAGGYDSGQSASIGPTLAAVQMDANETTEPVVLMRHLTTQEVGRTPFDEGRPYVPEAPADYESTIRWYYNPVGDVGYWTGARCSAAWVDVPGYSRVLYLTAYGAGKLEYSAQKLGWGAPVKSLLYAYDPDHFAAVAKGERKELGTPRDTYEFYPFNESETGVTTRADAIAFDRGSNRLWLLFNRGWVVGKESFPCVVAYDVAIDGEKPTDDTQMRDVVERLDAIEHEMAAINQRLGRAAESLSAD